jgi:hypothetical protein
MKSKRIVLSLLFLALIFTGCDDTPPAPEAADTRDAVPVATSSHEPGTLPARGLILRAVPKSEGLSSDRRFAFAEAILKAPSWSKAHVRTQALMNSISTPDADVTASVFMLEVWLLPTREVTPELLGATAFYVDLLLEHESPQAAVLAPAFRRLEGHWPAKRLAEARAAAVRAAERDLVEFGRVDCEDCSGARLLEALERARPQNNEFSYYTRTHDATRALRAALASQ